MGAVGGPIAIPAGSSGPLFLARFLLPRKPRAGPRLRLARFLLVPLVGTPLAGCACVVAVGTLLACGPAPVAVGTLVAG